MSITSHYADLCSRILHPDILLPILSFLPVTYLPPLLRSSRYLHDLAGPLLYRDLPLSPLTSSTLCPHLSPIASLCPPGASRSDLRTILSGDTPCRKRKLLESARILRIEQHNHAVIPPVISDLKLDMSRVERLHIESGKNICGCKGQCPIFRGLKPKIVIVESTTLDITHIGGLASSAQGEHLVIKFRPLNGNRYPKLNPDSLSPLRHIKKMTVIFTRPSYIDRYGQIVEESWVPKSLSVCAKSDRGGPPSFADVLQHIRHSSQGVPEVVIVGAEGLDEGWVRANLRDEAVQLAGREWISDAARRVIGDLPVDEMLKEDERRVGQTISFCTLPQWKVGPDGDLIAAPPISAGFKGKGVARRPISKHKAVTI